MLGKEEKQQFTKELNLIVQAKEKAQKFINDVEAIVGADQKDFKSLIDSVQNQNYAQALRRLLTLDKLSQALKNKKFVLLKMLFDVTEKENIAMDILERPIPAAQSKSTPKSAMDIAREKSDAVSVLAYLLYRNRNRKFTRGQANMIGELAKGIVQGFEPFDDGFKIKYNEHEITEADRANANFEKTCQNLLQAAAKKSQTSNSSTTQANNKAQKLTSEFAQLLEQIQSQQELPSRQGSSTQQVTHALTLREQVRRQFTPHQLRDYVQAGLFPVTAMSLFGLNSGSLIKDPLSVMALTIIASYGVVTPRHLLDSNFTTTITILTTLLTLFTMDRYMNTQDRSNAMNYFTDFAKFILTRMAMEFVPTISPVTTPAIKSAACTTISSARYAFAKAKSFANFVGSLCYNAMGRFDKVTNALDEMSSNSRYSPSSIKG